MIPAGLRDPSKTQDMLNPARRCFWDKIITVMNSIRLADRPGRRESGHSGNEKVNQMIVGR